MASHMSVLIIFIIFTIFEFSYAATNYEIEAKNFVKSASQRYFTLYDGIAQQTYTSNDDEDFDTIFNKLTIVKDIANELVGISKEANEFDLDKIQDVEVKSALKSLKTIANLFVLGDDYFSSILINLAALKQLATDKDISPYMGGINIPNYDGSQLAYYPEIQNIFRTSNDSDELKYYWETWREKNLLWSSINFYTIVEAFQKAAKIMDIKPLDFWYPYYNNNDFITNMEKVMDELKADYSEMHAFVRHELHKKYGNDVIHENGPIPDHLYEQVLEQVWQAGSVIEPYFPFKELPPYNDFLKGYESKQMISEAERFYTSLGFAPLEAKFHDEQLKEQDDEANSGDCRADIFDLTPHVYMKYCKKISFRKFLQNHGYITRVFYAREKKDLPAYYFDSYDLEYPLGESIILSASTPKHLSAIGLAKDFQFKDETLMNRLFRMSLHTIFNMQLYFVHSKVMNDLLDDKIDMDTVNKHYWDLLEKHAGIEPPISRSENDIDFPYKFYYNIEENYQTKKFVSEVLGYQFYRAFCQKSGNTGPLHNCDFYGNIMIGNDMKQMMSLGSSKPWNEVISKVLGSNFNLSASALLEYYKPILDWIKAKNKENKLKIGWNESQKKVI